MKRLLYAFLIVCFSAVAAHAQLTSCTQTLRLARSTYEQGRLHEIPGLVEKCLQGGFTQDERVEAYKLLCLSYIYLEDPQKADEAMLNLLRTDNYFEIRPETDPAEFVALYRTFRTDPIYRIGLKMGANATIPDVVDFLPANDLSSEYDFGFAFQAGIAADIPLTAMSGKLTVHPELALIMRNFKYTNEGTFNDATPEGDPFTRHYETNGVERHTWISLPVSVQYRLFDRKVQPYVSLGLSGDYLLSARNTFLRTKEDATSLDEQSIDLMNSRRRVNVSGILSAGVKVKVTGGFAVAEIRYVRSLANVNDPESIFTNFDRVNPTGGYVDGLFKINALQFTIGYMYNRFNPKKIKR